MSFCKLSVLSPSAIINFVVPAALSIDEFCIKFGIVSIEIRRFFFVNVASGQTIASVVVSLVSWHGVENCFASSLKFFSVRFVGGQTVALAVASSRNWYNVKICFGLLLTEVVRFRCLSSRNSVFVATNLRCLKNDGSISIVRFRC